MSELKPRITENGIDYILVGDYYIPDLKLPEEHRPIGKYMLAEYGTFKMANNIAFNKLNAPDLEMIVAGAIISAIGMLVGSLWNKKRHNQKK